MAIFRGSFFDFRGLFFAFRGRNRPEPRVIFSLVGINLTQENNKTCQCQYYDVQYVNLG